MRPDPPAGNNCTQHQNGATRSIGNLRKMWIDEINDNLMRLNVMLSFSVHCFRPEINPHKLQHFTWQQQQQQQTKEVI